MQKRKILDLIIALLCAILLWIYVVTVITPEDDVTISDIPITFVGESELRSEYGLTIANRTATAVTVKFHGSRAALRQLVAEKNNIMATLDVTGYTDEREYSATYTVKLPSALQDNSIIVTDRSPRTIQFSVEKLMMKSIPVKGVFDGTTAAGFTAGELRFDQDRITITGPAAEVETISYAQVVVGGTDVSELIDIRESYTLIDLDGNAVYSENITSDTADIGVQVPIWVDKTVPLTISLTPGAGADESNTTVAIAPETFVLSGETDTLNAIDSLDLGFLDLAQLRSGDTVQIPIELPDGVITPEQTLTANVTVTFTGLTEQQVTVQGISVTGLAPGMKAVLADQTLTVTLRAPESVMASQTDLTASASVDLSEYTTAGSYTVPVTITAPDGIGAVGSYEVAVELD